MRTKCGIDTNSETTKTPREWKYGNVNNIYKKDKKNKRSTEDKKNVNHLRRSISGNPSLLSRAQENYSNNNRKLEQKSTTKSDPLNKRSCENFKNWNDVRNKKKKCKIVDPNDNPILDWMYKATIILDRMSSGGNINSQQRPSTSGTNSRHSVQQKLKKR